MKTAKYEYKCRRCGQIIYGLNSNPNIAQVVMSYAVLDLPPEFPPNTIGGEQFHYKEIHHCDDGGLGLADFIGCGIKTEKQWENHHRFEQAVKEVSSKDKRKAKQFAKGYGASQQKLSDYDKKLMLSMETASSPRNGR